MLLHIGDNLKVEVGIHTFLAILGTACAASASYGILCWNVANLNAEVDNFSKKLDSVIAWEASQNQKMQNLSLTNGGPYGK